MVEIITFSNETFTDSILLIPVKHMLQIAVPVLVGVLILILFCCICNCFVCFCIGKKSKKKEKIPVRKPRSERDGTIYSEINPAGMIENQRIYPTNDKIIIINPMSIDSESQIELNDKRNKFQKSVSTESTYQEMSAPINKHSCKLESVKESLSSEEYNEISIV